MLGVVLLALSWDARAADPRAAFYGSKPWVDFASAGVIVREQWLPVEGTSLTLIHAVRTSPAVPPFEGELFAVETRTGSIWAGEIEATGCPPLETVSSVSVLYRQGGGVLVRMGQAPQPLRPFSSCGALIGAGPGMACTLRVPLKSSEPAIEAGPPQAKLGRTWVSASKGRVLVRNAPHAGLQLTTALRECLGEQPPALAPLEDRLALAAGRKLLLLSEQLTAFCVTCNEEPDSGSPSPLPPEAELERLGAKALAQWRVGRKDDALAGWRNLYGGFWGGNRTPPEGLLPTLERFGEALQQLGHTDQARQVFEEVWARTKTPSPSLLIHMGEVYLALSDGPAAAAAFRGALERAPTRSQREQALRELSVLERATVGAGGSSPKP